MKDKFYIYLDIDGVLNSRNWFKKFQMQQLMNADSFLLCDFPKYIDLKCLDALNLLIQNLERDYEVRLVISSTRKINPERLIADLKKSGIKYQGDYDCTPYVEFKRVPEIQKHIKENNVKNYVAIDDEDLSESSFPQKHQIKTSFDGEGLTKNLVKSFLDRDNVFDT